MNRGRLPDGHAGMLLHTNATMMTATAAWSCLLRCVFLICRCPWVSSCCNWNPHTGVSHVHGSIFLVQKRKAHDCAASQAEPTHWADSSAIQFVPNCCCKRCRCCCYLGLPEKVGWISCFTCQSWQQWQAVRNLDGQIWDCPLCIHAASHEEDQWQTTASFFRQVHNYRLVQVASVSIASHCYCIWVMDWILFS